MPGLIASGLDAINPRTRNKTANATFRIDPESTAATGGIAGGKQDVWALGLNWYPNNAIKFQLNYENVQVNHINAPGTDISANVIGLRSQIQL